MIGGEPNSIHTAILEVLDEPGTKTSERIQEAVNEEYGYSKRVIKAHTADLVDEGYVVEHDEIDGAWKAAEDKDLL